MNEDIIYIKSNRDKVSNFVQDARCKHCRWCYKRPGNDARTYFRWFCSSFKKDVSVNQFACHDFEPNEKYFIVNRYVQLNLFENGKSFH